MVRHSDTHRWPSWVTPGQTDPNSLDNLHPIPEFVEKMIPFYCMNIIMIDIVIEPVTNICCHGCDAKFAPRLTQTSSRSLAWSPRHKSQVRFVTELQSTNTGPGADCWHPPPPGRAVTGGGGCLCLLQRSTNGQRRHGRQIGQLRSGSNIPALVGSLVDIWYLWSFIVIPHSPGDFIYPIRRVQSGLKLGTHFFGSS